MLVTYRREGRNLDFITSQLAIGSRLEAQDPQLLAAAGIDSLLSFAPIPRPERISCQLQLGVQDRKPLSSAMIGTAVTFIRHQIQQGRRLLVHCEMGISRSPAFTACYLHEHEGMSLDDAFLRVREARPIAEPHPVLVRSIEDYYRSLFLSPVNS